MEEKINTEIMKRFGLILLVTAMACAQTDISGERMRQHVKFLASDLLEGRGVGTRGGELATNYIAAQFALAGAKPAGENSTYFQRVPMVGVTTSPDATLSAVGPNQTVSFKWLDDFVGESQLQEPTDQFDAEAVFVGHGIVAPEFHWDDYKGVDVKGKVLVLFTNEPPSNDPKFFGGRALTYYGRWTYKYEEAARMGAKAVLILHTTPTAGYGYDVLRSSEGKENPQLKLQPGQPALAFAGWITQDAGAKLLALSGKTVDEMLKAANSRDFRPIPLGIHIRADIPAQIRQLQASNVIAKVEGSDPQLKSQAVIFTAHWDHLGIGPAVNGDSIYNGAVDNATGCAMIIEMARAWAALEHKPKRSALFMAVTAEEAGLLGSEYYAEHPVIPARQDSAESEFRRLLSVRPHQGCFRHRRRTNHSLAGGGRSRASHGAHHQARRAARAGALLPFRSFLARARRRARPFPSTWARIITANPPVTATKFSKNTTTSIIISRPTNITTIGISRECRKRRSSAS